MTPDDLRALADAATPDYPQLSFGHPPAVSSLIVLAPDLARLCAEYAGAFEQIEKLHPKDRAESAHIARRALAKLAELNNTTERKPA